MTITQPEAAEGNGISRTNTSSQKRMAHSAKGRRLVPSYPS